MQLTIAYGNVATTTLQRLSSRVSGSKRPEQAIAESKAAVYYSYFFNNTMFLTIFSFLALYALKAFSKEMNYMISAGTFLLFIPYCYICSNLYVCVVAVVASAVTWYLSQNGYKLFRVAGTTASPQMAQIVFI